MLSELLMPSLSPTMEEGVIVTWHAKPGDKIVSGETVLAEIQTDKAVVEWQSLASGYLAEIILPAKSSAKVNMVTAILSSKAGEKDGLEAAVAKAKATNASFGAAAAPAEEPAAATPAAAPAAAAVPAAAPAAAPAAKAKASFRISPVAARLAAEHGIDLAQVQPSGTDGRIVRRDVEAAIANGTAKAGKGAVAAKPAKPLIKLARADRSDAPQTATPMRTAIGKRLLQSKTSIPHFYVTESVDAGSLTALREQCNAYEGVKLTVNDFIVRACAIALRHHPRVNSTNVRDKVVQHDSADISVAVAIPDGLITPIVFKAHTLTVAQISAKVRELAKKAADGKLQPNEFEGGSFTISNLGMYGIESFQAIVNPPQCAILAVGGIKDEPVVRQGAIVPGKVMRLTLSCDHRVVDGADAAAFLKNLRELLEAPAGLLV